MCNCLPSELEEQDMKLMEAFVLIESEYAKKMAAKQKEAEIKMKLRR